ncbi:hypothetical protein GP486_001272 [Trichoglossum hirsutum]|uniref:Uncharacterized protein n=1 Tax=Trichoglossum hirsutum TaxID=265104 RepID=A0A9P8LH81_9PEZI|nr:hypothetical protein GP486_001272 [Trichoglossum hirsutum]
MTKKELENQFKEHKAKLRKELQIERQRIEREKAQEIQGVNDQLIKASARIAELDLALSLERENVKNKKKRHARKRNTLEKENRDLKEELKQWKLEFAVGAEPFEDRCVSWCLQFILLPTS